MVRYLHVLVRKMLDLTICPMMAIASMDPLHVVNPSPRIMTQSCHKVGGFIHVS